MKKQMKAHSEPRGISAVVDRLIEMTMENVRVE
jgi:hypothetical protein